MNHDIFEGKWQQVRGEVKSWWGKLTDDDLDRAGGNYDVLTGMLQEKYGYTREAAGEEIDRRMAEFDGSHQDESYQDESRQDGSHQDESHKFEKSHQRD